MWPIRGAKLTQGFDPYGYRHHDGIDLSAPAGTPIMAAHAGRVLYAGRDFRGYGKLVIIESGSWATFYAHCKTIIVRQGQQVRAGQTVATVGRTGRATGNHLHFEVRSDRMALDPMDHLPLPSVASIRGAP